MYCLSCNLITNIFQTIFAEDFDECKDKPGECQGIGVAECASKFSSELRKTCPKTCGLCKGNS